MMSFKALFLIAFAGLVFSEAVEPEETFYQRPYPFYNFPPSPTKDVEDAALIRANNNNFLNGFRLPESVPRTAFQMCINPNNANRESGVVQLLPGIAPRECWFIIKVPDNGKKVEVHCSRVAVGKDAVLDLVKANDRRTQVDALTEGAQVVKDNDVYAIRYFDQSNSGSFTCDWRQVKA